MRTISNSEFTAHPEMYLDIAQVDDVRIQKGCKMFRLVFEQSVEPQAILAPDDDFRNAITGDELLAGVYSDLETFFAEKR